jgi:hypothetical protein
MRIVAVYWKGEEHQINCADQVAALPLRIPVVINLGTSSFPSLSPSQSSKYHSLMGPTSPIRAKKRGEAFSSTDFRNPAS